MVPLVEHLSPGETFDVAIMFSMTDQWHIYWQNPGDAGLATQFTWQLPPGFALVEQREPVPVRHNDDGIITFIHEAEAIYLFSILAPDDVNQVNTFSVEIDWLECKSICKAGANQASFILEKGHGSSSQDNAWKTIKHRAQIKFPSPHQKTQGRVSKNKDRVEYRFKKLRDDGMKLLSADFFPYEELLYNYATPIRIKTGFRNTSIIIPLLDYREKDPDALHGVLVQTFQTPTGLVTKQTIINKPLQP